MTVLDRFKDTDKYPRRLREKFATLIGLRDEKALFLKKEEMDRCGWHGNVADFPNASEEDLKRWTIVIPEIFLRRLSKDLKRTPNAVREQLQHMGLIDH